MFQSSSLSLSGKSQLVGDLATRLAKCCYTIHLNENFSMAVMTRFLRGVCESNLWGFMENINLLTRSVMSVISSHFQTIKTAQTIHLREFTLDQQTTRMFPGVAFLCTENIVQVLQFSLTHTKLLTGLGLSEEDSSLVAHSLQKDLGAASSHGNSALRDSQVNFASPTIFSHSISSQG